MKMTEQKEWNRPPKCMSHKYLQDYAEDHNCTFQEAILIHLYGVARNIWASLEEGTAKEEAEKISNKHKTKGETNDIPRTGD